jgi:hypothetical protein
VLQVRPQTLTSPLFKDRFQAYDFILNKFKTKLTTLKANKLNHAGRLTYINSVLAYIPIYYMSTALFSKTFVEKNQFHYSTILVRRNPAWQPNFAHCFSLMARYLPIAYEYTQSM